MDPVGYCLNLFPSETVDDVRRSLREHVVPLRERMGLEGPLPVEPRFGLPAIEALSGDPASATRLREEMQSYSLEPFSINGFPIGRFHGPRVKEDVFRPTWLEERRVEATVRLGEIAARLLGDPATVSTSTGSFKPFGHDDAILERIVHNFARVALEFRRLTQQSGKRVILCLEPEPLTSAENVPETIDLFRRLQRFGVDEIRRREGGTPGSARRWLREHVALNYDTSHFSLQFEPPEEALGALAREGIPVEKMHLASALAIPAPASNERGLAFLRELDEPRYLHQVLGRDAGGGITIRDRDVPAFLARDRDELSGVEEARVHFHLPLFFSGDDAVRSTHAETARAYRYARTHGTTRQFAIETYTLGILMEKRTIELRDLMDGIAREFRWLAEQETDR